MRRQGGVILVVVLWLLALLALLAVSQTAAVRTETQIVGNRLESATARAAAAAAVQMAIVDLSRPPSQRQWGTDGTPIEQEFEQTRLTLAIKDESGKVDLNTAPGPLLNALMLARGVDDLRRPALVDAILDWRDRDKLRRLNGAEAGDYRAAGFDYEPRNAPFQSIDELALVLGFDAELFHRLAGDLTVYSGRVDINPSAASAELLQSLQQLQTEPSDAMNEVPMGRRQGSGVLGGSTVFSIYAQAELDSGVNERLQAVVRLIPSRANAPLRYELLSWREGVAPLDTSGG